jgi:hypothetical protein
MRAVTSNPNLPADDPGQIGAAGVQWLRDVYDTEGPVSRDAVDRAAWAHQIRVANEAVTLVLADLHRTTSRRPVVRVEVLDGSLTIVIDDDYNAPSMFEWEPPAAIAEVAGYVQEQMADEIGNWPVCGAHDAGTFARVRDDTAVWWCRPDDHVLAPVGSLDAKSIRPL